MQPAWDTYLDALYSNTPRPAAYAVDPASFAIFYADRLPNALASKVLYSTNSSAECKQFIRDGLIWSGRAAGWNPRGALFHRVPIRAVVPRTWIEITHCASVGHEGWETMESVGLWAYVTPGSGVFAYSGKTIAFNDHKDAMRHFNVSSTTCARGSPARGWCGIVG